MNVLKILLGMVVMLAVTAGCDNGDDHRPPAGMGSIMLRNNTGDDIFVYLDGILSSNRADYATTTPYDLKPGSYRVSLTERRGWRSWSGFVDVLENRLAYLDVTLDLRNAYAYDVVTFFD